MINMEQDFMSSTELMRQLNWAFAKSSTSGFPLFAGALNLTATDGATVTTLQGEGLGLGTAAGAATTWATTATMTARKLEIF